MGIRLVKYGLNNNSGTYKHDELENRDLYDQHPIDSITNLRETLDGLNQFIDDLSHESLNGRDLDDQHPISSITGLQDALDNVSGIDEVIDTRSIDLDYTHDTKTLTASVNLVKSEDNAIQEKISGLYVDRYLDIEIEDSDSATLSFEGAGETLRTMYDTGMRFSHNGTWDNVSIPGETTSWYFDNTLDSFVQPTNTVSYTGFISTVEYRVYNHKALLKSSNSDNDGIGLVIAYATDDKGNPHTLSLIVNKGGEGHVGPWYYALVYNHFLPTQQVLFTKGNGPNGTIPGNHSTSGWSNSFIVLEVTKTGPEITCAASDYNSRDINLNTMIHIDLDDYEWGYLFRGKTRYGYSSQSQAYSYFQEIVFKGKGPLKANVKISSESENALSILEDGLFVKIKESGSTLLEVTQANHGLSDLDIVYVNSASRYLKASSSNEVASEAVGIVRYIDNNKFELVTSGLYETTGITFSKGSTLYLSTTGTLVTDITSDMKVIKHIGTVAPNGVFVNIQQGIWSKDFILKSPYTAPVTTHTHVHNKTYEYLSVVDFELDIPYNRCILKGFSVRLGRDTDTGSIPNGDKYAFAVLNSKYEEVFLVPRTEWASHYIRNIGFAPNPNGGVSIYTHDQNGSPAAREGVLYENYDGTYKIYFRIWCLGGTRYGASNNTINSITPYIQTIEEEK